MLVRHLEVSIEEIERVIAWLDPGNLGKLSANYFLSALREIQPSQGNKAGANEAGADDDDEEEDEWVSEYLNIIYRLSSLNFPRQNKGDNSFIVIQ